MKKRGESSKIREFCLALQRIGEDSLLEGRKLFLDPFENIKLVKSESSLYFKTNHLLVISFSFIKYLQRFKI
jgi:hypothetical protein